jgi:ribonuclease-3
MAKKRVSEKKWLKTLSRFEKKINYHFKKKELLIQALSHPSYFHEENKERKGDYEVMEFLGDAILGFLISEMVYKMRMLHSEGEMSKIKSFIVSRKSLHGEAKNLELGDLILVGKGEEKTGGRKKESILADTLEAVIAAIYLDGGMRAAKAFINGIFRGKTEKLVLQSMSRGLIRKDNKSALQEILQKRKDPLPEYVVVREEGPSHEKKFFVEMRLSGRSLAHGKGRSKKEAEQKAAKKALAKLLSHSRSPRKRKTS